MISLQKIITKLKSLIDKNTADITALNNGLAKDTADITALNNGLAKNTADITALNNGLAKNTADITAINGSLTRKLDSSSEVFTYNGLTTNADWCNYTGTYMTNPNTVSASDYGVIIVVAVPYPRTGFNGANWIHQLWLTNNNVVQHRFSVCATDGGHWSAWTRL